MRRVLKDTDEGNGIQSSLWARYVQDCPTGNGKGRFRDENDDWDSGGARLRLMWRRPLRLHRGPVGIGCGDFCGIYGPELNL
jgi:hypothetical protein